MTRADITPHDQADLSPGSMLIAELFEVELVETIRRILPYVAANVLAKMQGQEVAELAGVVESDRQRRDRAIAQLRGEGYEGSSFDVLARRAFAHEVENWYVAAEEECRGHLVSRAGQAKGVEPRTLFTGPENRARKWASEELLAYWRENGRMTFEEFKLMLLGYTQGAATLRNMAEPWGA